MSDVLEDAEDAGGDGNATRRVVALRDELLHQAGAFLAANGSVTVSSPAIVVSVQVAAAGEPAPRADGAGALYASGAYFLLLLFSVQFYLVVGYYAVCEGDRQLRAARASGARGARRAGGRARRACGPRRAWWRCRCRCWRASARPTSSARSRSRRATASRASSSPTPRCTRSTTLAPALLLALSAIVVSWYQILEERAKARGLTGRCLAALLAANGFYALCALGLSAAAAAGPSAATTATPRARAHLAFFAGACVSQGCAYVHLGLRLGRRLDALGQADERVARLKRRAADAPADDGGSARSRIRCRDGGPLDEGDVYGAREEQPVVIVNPTAPRAGGDEGPALGDEGDVYGAKDDDVVVVANPASRHAADADDGPDLGDEGDVYGGDEKEDVVVVDNPARAALPGGDDDVDVDLGDAHDDPGDAVAGASSLARESHANA
ncbi:hypothetical protein SO694_0024104 [Aureococcus anophagefferens]|uniref:THH1/TOM1/TOM3 domain-containing protein n=1 Tax=Aureococcus anophagefferens TaxID=44056 RepID=A0ABR1FRJ1_AURAN